MMKRWAKAAGMTGGMMAALGAASLGQQGAAPPPLPVPPPAASVATNGKTLVMQGTIKFLEESDVAASREGVIQEIEFNVGDLIEKDMEIGSLHKEMAELKVARQKVAAQALGAQQKAQASYNLAMNELAIRENLRRKRADLVTDEEMRAYQARVMAAEADIKQAGEEKRLAEAELNLAEQDLKDHFIRAPFTGYVTNRMKDPGEAVQANEPVLRLGRADMFRFFGYLPYESAAKVQIGDLVKVKLEIPDSDLPIENEVFEGKITHVGREVTSVGKTEVQIMAEIANTDTDVNAAGIGKGLLAGLKGRMTILLGTAKPGETAAAPAAAAPAAAAPVARTAAAPR